MRCILSAFVLALGSGCSPEPVLLFDGEWIDVFGHDRAADEACAGTFAYLDDWSSMIAAEFGVDVPLGAFHWYSRTDDLPCREEATACAKPGAAHSPILPHKHEVVHLANYIAGMCPSVLAEGLAAYYTHGSGSASGDLDLLSARLEQPGVSVPGEEYAIAGRFAAFLVHEFGLAAVLDVCVTTGRRPNAAELSSAMEAIMGTSAADLVEQLAAEPEECNEVARYQARLYACAEHALAPHAGIVEAETDFEATYTLGCEHERSIGSVDRELEFIHQIEFAEAGSYRIYLHPADGGELRAPPVRMILARCGYCGEVAQFHAGIHGHDFELEAGRYWLEFRAPPDFVEPIKLTIRHR